MKLVVLEPDHIAFGKWHGFIVVEKNLTLTSERNPDLFRRRVTVRRILAPGATVTRVTVTRFDREFSGKSN